MVACLFRANCRAMFTLEENVADQLFGALRTFWDNYMATLRQTHLQHVQAAEQRVTAEWAAVNHAYVLKSYCCDVPLLNCSSTVPTSPQCSVL
jgi:hypothetical protein